VNLKKLFLLIILMLLSAETYAVAICKNCTVTGIQADPRRGGTYIFVDGDWSESNTTCNNTLSVKTFWVEAGASVENTTVSLAMLALSTGKTLGYIHGTGICTPENYEHVSILYLKK